MISLLIINEKGGLIDLDDFSRQSGFSTQVLSKKQATAKKVEEIQPELILILTQSKNIHQIKTDVETMRANFGVADPVIFMCLTEYPDSSQRLQLIRAGCNHFFTAGCVAEEIRHVYESYNQNRVFQQEIGILENKLEKAFQYLDSFKADSKKTKSELYEERISLNNALKQVNQMTRERSRLKKEKAALKKAFKENIDGFGNILSDLITLQVEKNRGHGERVAHIAEFVGKDLGLDEKKVEDLKKAAMLHEVGLLFIPWQVIAKDKDQLADWEKDLFIQHPVKGAKLLSKTSELENCASIIASLHENADGTGRPKGLKRRYIPLMSKILAGAELFDSLKDDPEIKDLQGLLEALEKYSGTRLDPNIVARLEKYAVLHMGSDAYNVRGVGIHQLEPGMTLGTAIFTNTGTKLFSVNTLLTQDAIGKIKKYSREYPIDEIVYVRA